MMMGVLFPHLNIHGAIPKRKNIFPERKYLLPSIFIIDSEFNLMKSISCMTIIGINNFWNFKKAKAILYKNDLIISLKYLLFQMKY